MGAGGGLGVVLHGKCREFLVAQALSPLPSRGQEVVRTLRDYFLVSQACPASRKAFALLSKSSTSVSENEVSAR
jgi:hypothetical protein